MSSWLLGRGRRDEMRTARSSSGPRNTVKTTTVGSFLCSDALGLAYLRIPKCGCTTIEGWMASQHPNYDPVSPHKIHSADALREYFDCVRPMVGHEDGYFRFTFVRDPLRRFLSFYNDKIMGPDRPALFEHPSMLGLTRGLSISECLKIMRRSGPSHKFNPHFAPQHHFLMDGSRIRVDFIGRLEQFEVGARVVVSMSGGESNPQWLNKSAKRKKRPVSLTKGELAMFLDLFQPDYDLLGYPLPRV